MHPCLGRSLRTLSVLLVAVFSTAWASESHSPDNAGGVRAFQGYLALVVGASSYNLVVFDLGSGESRVFAKLERGDKPRSLALNDYGRIFVGLSGNRKNIIELARSTPSGSPPLQR